MSWWDQRAPSVSREWRVPLLLVIFFSALYLPGLGDYGLFDPWETHYGEVARGMVETGNYIDPVWAQPGTPFLIMIKDIEALNIKSV